MGPYVSDLDMARFQSKRNILISGDISRDTAVRVMLLLERMGEESPDSPIFLVMDSPGGDVQSGWSIIDAMAICPSPVNTVCFGECSSMAAVIFSCGAKGGRMMLPHSRLMIHQPWGGSFASKESELREASERITRTRNELERHLSESSGNPLERIHSMCESDFVMSAEEAVSLGFADSIIVR